MKKHDLEKNGVITRDEFKALFLDTSDLTYARSYTLGSNNGQTAGATAQ